MPVLLLFLTVLTMVGCSTVHSPSRQELYGAFSKDEKQGNLQKARMDLGRILKVQPRDSIAWNDLAYLDFLSRHYKKAQGDLSQGLAIDPASRFLLLNKARLLLAEGENEKSRTVLLSMISSHPWPKGFRMVLAIADMRTGHLDSARVLLSEILSDRPSDNLASIYLSRLLSFQSSLKGTVNG
jgi:Flp pilus assembly protein TadD